VEPVRPPAADDCLSDVLPPVRSGIES